VGGLKVFPRAIEAALPPETQVQTRIGHLPRHSMSFACYKDRNAVDAEAAEAALAEVEDRDPVAK